MFRIAVYGKGGAGKSTVSANLSYLLSLGGSVLHVGCDPKHDSVRLLVDGRVETFAERPDPLPVYEGPNGMSCIECGGALPGTGCAGKGLELLFSSISGLEADYRVSDVLGDVVCGGFSVPARKEHCDAVLIVVSGEFMSLFAANNILRGLGNINPDASVLGLVLNRRGIEDEGRIVSSFARAVGLPVVCDIPRSDLFRRAEAEGRTLCELFPDSPEARTLRDLAGLVASGPELRTPTPLSDEGMGDLAAGRVPRRGGCTGNRRGCSFDSYDSERNITYRGRIAMPACTSHGAADAAMRVTDAATIFHGPDNCAHLAEYAYRRRLVLASADPPEAVPPSNVYSSGMDATGAFSNRTGLDAAVARARADGFRHAFLIPTCASEIIGFDVRGEAERLTAEYGIDVMPAMPDDTFLGGKFGGTLGVFRALVERMPPMETVPDTVNLIGRRFYGVRRERSMASLSKLMGLLGLRPHRMFLDQCTLSETLRFREGEFDVVLGRSRFNDRLAETISDVTGRRRALPLDIPVGLTESLEFVSDLAGYTGRDGPLDDARSALTEEFESGISEVRDRVGGREAIVYCLSARDIAWQVETLMGMGLDVRVIFAEGEVVNHNERVPDLGVPTAEGDLSTLAGMCLDEDPDIVVTNDPSRVRTLGVPWGPLGSRNFGVEGAVEWAGTIESCMSLPAVGWRGGL